MEQKRHGSIGWMDFSSWSGFSCHHGVPIPALHTATLDILSPVLSKTTPRIPLCSTKIHGLASPATVESIGLVVMTHESSSWSYIKGVYHPLHIPIALEDKHIHIWWIYYSRIPKIKPNRRSKTPTKPQVSVESASIQEHKYNSHLKMQKKRG